MNPKHPVLALLAAGLLIAGLLIAGGLSLYQLGLRAGMASPSVHSKSHDSDTKDAVDPSTWSIAEGEAATRRHSESGLRAGDIDPVTRREILYYQDPMMPGKKFEAPGKSPYMDMMLVPVYGGGARKSDASGDEGVVISSRLQQNMGMRTAKVEVGDIKPQVLAVGAIAWNERDQVNIQARALGYVEKLHVDAKLDTVTAGQPLLDLYVPDWVAVQEEFLAVQRMEAVGVDELLEASRSRMRQSGMADEHIRLVEKNARVQARLTLRSPLDGVVTELFAREGMTVTPSETLVRIQGINPVWVEAEIPETQAALLTQGNKVEAKTPAFPGRVFTGEVEALLPQVNPDTRTITARMVLANPSGQLVPGMFAEMRVAGKRNTEMLLVPSEAVIRTGNRDLVMVAEDGGLFRPVEVITGIEDGSRTEIRQGLRAGQSIVVSGQFLVDSEASLKGIEARLGEAALAAESYHAQARIEAINAERLTLSHSPVPALKWPSMTMDFRLSPDLEPQDLSVGQGIDIEFILEKNRPPLIIGLGNVDRDSAGDAP